jgi:chromate transporter
MTAAPAPRVPVLTIAREWGRIGCTGFGGPPAHIALLRTLCVQRRGWLSATEFEDGVAVTSLLPGPASTQLAILCAWRIGGPVGALVGGLCFIVPAVVTVLALSALFLAATAPAWIRGAAAGAGAAVPAVAAAAAVSLVPASWRRAGTRRMAGTHGTGPEPGAGQANPADRSPWGARARWATYLVAGVVVAVLAGPLVVAVLLASGVAEYAVRAASRDSGRAVLVPPAAWAARAVRAAAASASAGGGLLSLAWVAVKVGALSFGGGFVIIPLMQHDAVHTYHWMTSAQFLTAVALGQVTPGPVVATIGAVGYAAAGLGGGLLAALIAFTPSFVFVLGGASRFDQIRASPAIQAFLSGAGPAAIGAIAGAAITLGLALTQVWQVVVLAAALGWLLALRRGVVTAIVVAAAVGVVVTVAGLAS